MMWKRSFKQAKACGAARALALAVLATLAHGGAAADLVIEIPGAGGGGGGGGGEEAGGAGRYRLDYRPPHGSPAPNFTVPARASTINFQGLPGTQYHFMLYYSNDTFADLLTWNQTIVTAPEPPSNLTVTLGRNKQATIAWAPPAHGSYTGFRFRVVPVSVAGGGAGGGGGGGEARNVTVEGGASSHTLRELAPGATYTLHAFTLLHDKESAAYASRNFTTKPNTPGKFIVWFRNETTLLVLWQPPYPPGAYTHYKVSILPGDARDSELYVEKEGEPPGPAQAAFKGLVPGRAYNISVQTVSEPEISAPTTAQYRTVPLRPAAVAVLRAAETALRVRWAPPAERCEFDKYQVSLAGGAAGAAGAAGPGGARRPAPLLRGRAEPPEADFEGLEPGAHYTVTVKTMSGKVTSWPQTAEVTLKPLPVRELRWNGSALSWAPAEGGAQDGYRVAYHEAGPGREDANSLTVAAPPVALDALLPGRNYSVSVAALSRGVAGNDTALHALTPPLAPALRELQALPALPPPGGLRLAWSSDVNSRQDAYEVRWRRADAEGEGEWATLQTRAASATLAALEPGAVYELQVAALAHGLRSEPHVALKPTRPLPPVSMSVERATSNSAVVRWVAPGGGRVGQFVLRYRTGAPAAAWTRLPPLDRNHTEAEIVDMTHGERYEIQLDTASLPAAGERVESGQPLTATHTVRPNPVSDVAALVDTRNMTLEWPRPKGRVEWYSLRWWPTDPPDPADSADPADPAGPPHSADPTLAPDPTSDEAAAAGGGGARNVSAGADGADGAAGGALLGGLAPGAAYRVAIAAHSHGLASDLFTMDTRTRPLIQSEMTIVTESDDGDDNSTLPAFLVVYTKTPARASRFDAYRFRLEARGEAPREQTRPAAAAGHTLAFRGLRPGRLYNITMWTLSRNVSSHPVQRQARLFPRPVPWVNASEVGARSVALVWGAPRGDYTDFQLQWLDGGRLETRAAADTRCTAEPLRPYTDYEFTVEVRSGTPATLLTRSAGASVALRTRQAPPGPPRRFQPSDSRPSEVSFAWQLEPPEQHGPLRRFVLEYGPAASPDRWQELHFPPDARAGTVSGLAAGAAYEFRLRGENDAGAGAAARWAERTAIAAPPRPAAAAVPAAARRSSTTLAVRFRADYFSPANGNVTAYTLVVAEQPPVATSGAAAAAAAAAEPARLPSWRDVARLPVWPPYQVTEPYYPFHASAVEEFTIGSERCEAGGRAYCNGPLKPSTRYFVKLRAFTAPDKFTDTDYVQLYTEADNTAWIVGGCALLGAALVGAGVGAALRRRRRAARAAAAPPRAPAAPPPRLARPVRVADFLDHYRVMSADSDFRFSEEFEELKHVGRDQPCTAADLPCNRPKNRFTNILPYDHSRFKLQPVDDEEGSDYINANFVPGFHSPREFIVTQGPLHCTRDDFWRMCWESGARAVVMLTRCVEKGREKCDRYWPYDTRPVYYGDIAVTALNESRYPDWTVTELAAARGAEQRVLLHFHFTTWPDFGVPSPPTTLVRFVRAFRERAPADARPVVVHCSAGVGRSGTFIALDRALAALAARHDTLDVFHCVYSMRRERVWMVQTEQQYICIHQCLVAVLEGQELAAPQPNHHLNQAYEDDEGIAESGM